MPIFDYICTECKKVFEKLVRTDTAKVECPSCGGSAEKKVSAPGHFSGSGDGWFGKSK